MSERNCKSCTWWKNYSDRVYARMSGIRGDIHPGVLELRRCRFIPAPRSDSGGTYYTDGESACGSWEAADV